MWKKVFGIRVPVNTDAIKGIRRLIELLKSQIIHLKKCDI